VKKAERKAWKTVMLRLERSDKRLRKLQAAANKGHEAIETSFRQLGSNPKRARKGDLNQIATSIVAQSSSQTLPGKNPAAVALGKLGGLKGGKARAAKLSAKKRSQIAAKAAKERWSKNQRITGVFRNRRTQAR
jgi:hypothetical protein